MSTQTREIIVWLFLLVLVFTVWWYVDSAISAVLLIATALLPLLRYSIRNIPPTEQLVVFRLGEHVGAKGPGPIILLPLLETGVRVDIRQLTQPIGPISCITQDKIPIEIDLVASWYIKEPSLRVMKAAENLNLAIRSLLDGLLREIVANYLLDSVLTQTRSIRQELKEKASDKVQDWGVEIVDLEIVGKINIPTQVQEAINREAAAKRDGDAIRHKAEAEAAALETLQRIAARVDERVLRLRYLTALEAIGAAESTKYILAIEPREILRSWTAQEPPGEQEEADE